MARNVEGCKNGENRRYLEIYVDIERMANRSSGSWTDWISSEVGEIIQGIYLYNIGSFPIHSHLP